MLRLFSKLEVISQRKALRHNQADRINRIDRNFEMQKKRVDEGRRLEYCYIVPAKRISEWTVATIGSQVN